MPISLLGTIDNAFVVAPRARDRNSLKDFIEASKKGRNFTFASPGVGTNLHLLGELLRVHENLNMTHVPYRAFPTAFQDVMGGRVDMVVAGVPPITGLLATGKLKALAVTGPKRVAVLPDVPTTKELGYDDLTFVGWFGLLAPAGTPQVDHRQAQCRSQGDLAAAGLSRELREDLRDAVRRRRRGVQDADGCRKRADG